MLTSDAGRVQRQNVQKPTAVVIPRRKLNKTRAVNTSVVDGIINLLCSTGSDGRKSALSRGPTSAKTTDRITMVLKTKGVIGVIRFTEN